MNKLQSLYASYRGFVQKLDSFILLLIRIVLAYGFYGPASMKVKDISAIADWFKELGLPFPLVNAWLAVTTEVSGIILIALGLGTRIIAIPMIIVLLVAIRTVHWVNGFEAGNNGYEIPLYYILMLLVLIVFGSGKFGLDHWIRRLIS